MVHESNEPDNMDELLAALSIGEIPPICPEHWNEKFFPRMTPEEAKLYFRVMVSNDWYAWPVPWMGKLLEIKETIVSGPMFRQLIEKADLQASDPQHGSVEDIAKYGPYYYGVVWLATDYFGSDRNEITLYLIRAKTLAPVFAMVVSDLMIKEVMSELYQLEKETGTKFPVRLLRVIVGDSESQVTTSDNTPNSIECGKCKGRIFVIKYPIESEVEIQLFDVGNMIQDNWFQDIESDHIPDAAWRCVNCNEIFHSQKEIKKILSEATFGMVNQGIHGMSDTSSNKELRNND